MYRDTNGWSTGFSRNHFGRCYHLPSCLLSSSHIYSAACRWGGLNQPLVGSRDAPTQENQTTPLARLQTAVSNASPGPKACWGNTFLICKTFLRVLQLPWPLNSQCSKLQREHSHRVDLAQNKLVTDVKDPVHTFSKLKKTQRSNTALFFSSFFPAFSLSFKLIWFLTACYPNSSTSPPSHSDTDQIGPFHIRGDVLQFSWDLSVYQDFIEIFALNHWITKLLLEEGYNFYFFFTVRLTHTVSHLFLNCILIIFAKLLFDENKLFDLLRKETFRNEQSRTLVCLPATHSGSSTFLFPFNGLFV